MDAHEAQQVHQFRMGFIPQVLSRVRVLRQGIRVGELALDGAASPSVEVGVGAEAAHDTEPHDLGHQRGRSLDHRADRGLLVYLGRPLLVQLIHQHMGVLVDEGLEQIPQCPLAGLGIVGSEPADKGLSFFRNRGASPAAPDVQHPGDSSRVAEQVPQLAIEDARFLVYRLSVGVDL